MRLRGLKEKDIQKALIEWSQYVPCRTHGGYIFDYLFATPNGGYRKLLEAVELKRQGVKAGVPDLFLALPSKGHHGLFLELKRDNKCKVTEAQNCFIERMKLVGYEAFVAYSLDEAISIIQNYLR